MDILDNSTLLSTGFNSFDCGNFSSVRLCQSGTKYKSSQSIRHCTIMSLFEKAAQQDFSRELFNSL
jgi:hypothetical protein